jgi:hypothetical protein
MKLMNTAWGEYVLLLKKYKLNNSKTEQPPLEVLAKGCLILLTQMVANNRYEKVLRNVKGSRDVYASSSPRADEKYYGIYDKRVNEMKEAAELIGNK